MVPNPNDRPSAAEIVSKVRDLATLPDTYAQVKAVLDDRNASQQDLADALSSDAVISARLLRIANSAFYGMPSEIATISRAINILGTQQVHDLVLATTVLQTFGELSRRLGDPHAFWYSCLVAGCAAKFLAEDCNILDSERLFVAGLLAQIGLLVLNQELPKQMDDIQQQARQQGADPAVVQRTQLGFDYATVSAGLFSAWRLPKELVMPIALHTTPAKADDGRLEASIIHIAVQLAANHRSKGSRARLKGRLDQSACETTELSLEQLDRIEKSAIALADQIAPTMLEAVA